MMAKKTTSVPDVGYVAVGQRNKLLNRLKYFQYRDGSVRRSEYLPTRKWSAVPRNLRDHRVTLESGQERWVDHGMGGHYGEILKSAEEQQGSRVLAWSYVISPDPELISQIPKAQRYALVAQVTEQVIDTYFERRGWSNQPYSYVIHNRKTLGAGKPHVHSHVIAAATYYGEGGERRDCVNFAEHINKLHEISRDVFHRKLAQAIGVERAQELLKERGYSLPDDVLRDYQALVPEMSPAADDFSDWFPRRERGR